ncbi:hypothetical protein [Bartonella sp. CB169]
MKVEVEKFRDHLRLKSGANVTEIDWLVTWHNWVRKTVGDLGKGN